MKTMHIIYSKYISTECLYVVVRKLPYNLRFAKLQFEIKGFKVSLVFTRLLLNLPNE